MKDLSAAMKKERKYGSGKTISRREKKLMKREVWGVPPLRKKAMQTMGRRASARVKKESRTWVLKGGLPP